LQCLYINNLCRQQSHARGLTRSQSAIPEKGHFVYTFHQALSAEYKNTKKGRCTIER
jgi:hypothetical protein